MELPCFWPIMRATCSYLVPTDSKLETTAKEEKNRDGPVFVNKNGEIVIHILAKPGARVNSITDISVDGVGVQVAGKPVDGEANIELLKYITNVLALKKNEVSLDKGSKCRQKTLVVSKKGCTVDYVLNKLKEEIG